jgi:FAD-dependent urate hydroxylase
VTGEKIDRQYLGYVNFNGIITSDDAVAPATSWITWVGEGKRASVMPVGGGRSYAFFDLPMPAEVAEPAGVAPVEELRKGFAGWAPPVMRLIDNMDPARTNRVLIHDLPTVNCWHRSRVVLLGDAVHTMAPDLGQGGCQALEDGLVLAHYLTSTDVSVPDALARYATERRPRTAEIVRRARKRAAVTHGFDPEATGQWYRELAVETGANVIAGLAESVVTGPCR